MMHHHHHKEQYKIGDLIKMPHFGLGLLIGETEGKRIFRVYWFKNRVTTYLFKDHVLSKDSLKENIK